MCRIRRYQIKDWRSAGLDVDGVDFTRRHGRDEDDVLLATFLRVAEGSDRQESAFGIRDVASFGNYDAENVSITALIM